jgi:hypothetical protein
MTTAEIIKNFMKGGGIASISEKQRAWLISQANSERILVDSDGFNQSIFFDDHYYKIRNCRRMASGGSYVGTKIIQGRYIIERMYHIKFIGTGHTCVYNYSDIDHLKREGQHQFEILNPKHLVK